MTLGVIVNKSHDYDEGSFTLVLWETSKVVPYRVWTSRFRLQGPFAVVTKSPGSSIAKVVVLTRGTFDLVHSRKTRTGRHKGVAP